MYVFVDTNILAADAWMAGQKFRLLFDYLAKTHGRLVLADVVLFELRGVVRRLLRERADALAKAVREAHSLNMATTVDAPEADALYAEAYDKWEEAGKALGTRLEVERLPLDPSILGPVVVRAAERIPPVRPDGKETRDAIVWLSFLGFLRKHPNAQVAFISGNTRDFGSPDGASFRPELEAEIQGHRGGVRYYRTLDEFNREHAQPIAHLTNEWVNARVDSASLHELLDRFLDDHVDPQAFSIASLDDRELYRPYAIEHLYTPEATLFEVFVWKVSGDQLEVSLDYQVSVEAELSCERVVLPYSPTRPDDLHFANQVWPQLRSFTGFLSAVATVSARIESGELVLGSVEGLRR